MFGLTNQIGDTTLDYSVGFVTSLQYTRRGSHLWNDEVSPAPTMSLLDDDDELTGVNLADFGLTFSLLEPADFDFDYD